MLSTDYVIKKLNAEFVPCLIRLTDQGWPDLKALEVWKWAQEWSPFGEVGFFGSVVTDPSGRFLLSYAGNGRKDLFRSSPNYHPDLYMGFLERSRWALHEFNRIRVSKQSKAEKREAISHLIARDTGVDRDVVAWWEEHHDPGLFDGLEE